MLRMTSSGTEASMTAIRLARAATGREPSSSSPAPTTGTPTGCSRRPARAWRRSRCRRAPACPAAAAAATIVVPWNDPDALIAATEHNRLAAIIAEPLPANMGLVPPSEGFLTLVRERADATGALLILDEVISGFRVARGGAQELLGVSGDIVVLGKVIGGGLPAAALGGRGELMRLLAPAGEVYQAGTLSGNPLAVAAGLATLELLDEARLRAARRDHRAPGPRPGRGGRRSRAGIPCRSSARPAW